MINHPLTEKFEMLLNSKWKSSSLALSILDVSDEQYAVTVNIDEAVASNKVLRAVWITAKLLKAVPFTQIYYITYLDVVILCLNP